MNCSLEPIAASCSDDVERAITRSIRVISGTSRMFRIGTYLARFLIFATTSQWCPVRILHYGLAGFLGAIGRKLSNFDQTFSSSFNRISLRNLYLSQSLLLRFPFFLITYDRCNFLTGRYWNQGEKHPHFSHFLHFLRKKGKIIFILQRVKLYAISKMNFRQSKLSLILSAMT